MSTFTWAPGYPPELIEEPRVLSARFGDGYEQRAGDGVNNVAQVWSLTFPNVTDATADAIVAFLRAAGGAIGFLWTPPRSATQIAVVCRSWRRQVTSRNASSVYATFEQIPSLGVS